MENSLAPSGILFEDATLVTGAEYGMQEDDMSCGLHSLMGGYIGENIGD